MKKNDANVVVINSVGELDTYKLFNTCLIQVLWNL